MDNQLWDCHTWTFMALKARKRIRKNIFTVHEYQEFCIQFYNGVIHKVHCVDHVYNSWANTKTFRELFSSPDGSTNLVPLILVLKNSKNKSFISECLPFLFKTITAWIKIDGYMGFNIIKLISEFHGVKININGTF